MLRVPTIVLLMWMAAMAAMAQDSVPASTPTADEATASTLPDAPTPVAAEAFLSTPPDRAPGEILAGDQYRPLTRQQKWDQFVRRTHAPATFAGVGANTAYSRATGNYMYCCGIGNESGYGSWGQQYAATMIDSETRSLFGNYLFPVLLKEDPRYFPKRTGGTLARAWYAATRVLVTRTDSGHNTFNFSEVLGVTLAKMLSDSYYYYPNGQRTPLRTANRIAGAIQGDATSNLVSEFWPDIQRVLQRCTPKRLQKVESRLASRNPSQPY